MKTLDERFIDWEGDSFGYGYGRGELHILPALKRFLDLCPEQGLGTYDCSDLERELTPTVAWLLINVLCRADVLEYGTSSRYGWLTLPGLALKRYVESKTALELVDLVCGAAEDYVRRHPNACNCGPNGYERGRVCDNPFWAASRAAA